MRNEDRPEPGVPGRTPLVTDGSPASFPRPRPRLYVGRAAGLFALFAAFFVVLASGSAPCSFARATHLPCPGCGSTRAVWALAHGDVAGALRMNPLGPVLAALVGLLGLLVTWYVLRDGTPNRITDTRVGRVIPGVVLVVALLELALWGLRFCGLFGGPVPI